MADDHAIVLEGLQHILEANTIEVVGCAIDANSAWSIYKKQKPDVLVTDISMPGTAGIDSVSYIRQHEPNAKIVVFSIHQNIQLVDRILNAGASAYVTKSSQLSELVTAIQAVHTGKSYIATELAQSLIYTRMGHTQNPVSTLSEREFNIFCSVAEGNSIPDIACNMFLAEKTIANYIGQIKQKLELKNSADFVRLAIQNNLIQIDGVTINIGEHVDHKGRCTE